MKFNNNKNFSANRKSTIIRLCAVALIAVIGLVILAIIIPYSNKAVKLMTVNEVIASATLFITLGTVVIKISENILKRRVECSTQWKMSAFRLIHAGRLGSWGNPGAGNQHWAGRFYGCMRQQLEKFGFREKIF